MSNLKFTIGSLDKKEKSLELRRDPIRSQAYLLRNYSQQNSKQKIAKVYL